jgi:hypothetical protein
MRKILTILGIINIILSLLLLWLLRTFETFNIILILYSFIIGSMCLFAGVKGNSNSSNP